MRDSTIARSYADALYGVGERHDELEAFASAFDEFVAVLDEQPRVRTFLETPKVEPAAKKRVLDDALGDRVPRRFLNFLRVVLDKRRQRLLSEIAREYRAILDERLGRVHVEVLLAREPDPAYREAVTSRLTEMLGSTVVPHIRVEPEIIGGIIVRYGDYVMDGSVRRRLRTLRRRMLAQPAST